MPLPATADLEGAAACEALPLRAPRLRLPTASDRARQQESRAGHYNRYDKVQALLAQGLSQRHIARLLDIRRTTVRHFVHAEQFSERATSAATPSNLDLYLTYLQQRLREGCHNSQQLWREIQAQGYLNGPRQVMRWAHYRRTEPAHSMPNAYRQTSAADGPNSSQPSNDHQAVALLGLGSTKELVRLLLHDHET